MEMGEKETSNKIQKMGKAKVFLSNRKRKRLELLWEERWKKGNFDESNGCEDKAAYKDQG